MQYHIALMEGDLNTFCENHCFVLTVDEGNTPAKQQGMSGEYILLEFADWNQYSPTSLYEKDKEMRGKPKTIVVMKDGIISQHHFEDTIGAQFGIIQVSREEKMRINQAYDGWRKQNRR